MNLFKFFKKKEEKEFDLRYSGHYYERAMIDMIAEIKALKRYLPIDTVQHLEKKFSNTIKMTVDTARNQGIDYGRKTPNNINHRYFESDAYHYPNCIIEKL